MGVQKRINAKRYVIYIVVLLMSHILQNTLRIFPEIASVRPVLLISAVVCISMFEGEIAGAVAGFFAGALWDTVTVSNDGYNALFLMTVCALCGILVRIFMRNNIITYIIMNISVTVIYFLSYMLFFVVAKGIDGAGMLFLRYYLPMALYSVVLTPFWYMIIRGINRKFSIDYMEY